MVALWLTDGSSVEYLDLCAPEFHEKRNTTLIYALDLCVAPRRYILTNVPTNRERMWRYQKQSFEHDSFFPNTKLIQVFTQRLGVNIANMTVSFSFFNDFSEVILQRLATKWELKAAGRFLKHVKAYCDYVEKSLFRAYLLSNPYCVTITFEKPPVCYRRDSSLAFITYVQEEAASKIMKILFENLCTDSKLVAGFFHTMCIRGLTIRLRALFTYEAKVLDYILEHLTREKYDILHIFDILNRKNSSEIRSNPEHLLVLLKYGLKFKFEPNPLALIMFNQFYPSRYQREIWITHRVLETRRTDLKAREAAIIEVLVNFLNYSVPHFAVYLECLRYIWRSVPDAFISYEEMRNLLCRNANATNLENRCEELQKCEFESFESILQPRSLLHYSRCVIRQALICNSQLPGGISLLGLPKRLQAYLRLEF
ncbi:uncharacterized protein LOC118195408 [Stegodyphus dumicola]|uniref:uncharacterized protein LOC118195408 n=1 Tax=Stegodyphus dumicola TaxID=202533 RepID=UPI0015B20910|nr:uncharacterized protein LOC118195408 [Stegodyphus dumicola]